MIAKDITTLTPEARHIGIVGGGNWFQVAIEFFALLVREGKLNPDTAILDLGCGFGRMAIPLAYYLGEEGRYEGLDANAEMIQWATRNITTANPRMGFRHADVRNQFYWPRGAVPADQYRFPYEDAQFDVVLAASLFTHLPPDQARNYLRECRRVMRPEARLVATWFLLTPDSRGRIERGEGTQPFTENHAEYNTRPGEPPENAVACDLEFVEQWGRDAGLKVDRLLPGNWCGRSSPNSYQDITVLCPA